MYYIIAAVITMIRIVLILTVVIGRRVIPIRQITLGLVIPVVVLQIV